MSSINYSFMFIIRAPERQFRLVLRIHAITDRETGHLKSRIELKTLFLWALFVSKPSRLPSKLQSQRAWRFVSSMATFSNKAKSSGSWSCWLAPVRLSSLFFLSLPYRVKRNQVNTRESQISATRIKAARPSSGGSSARTYADKILFPPIPTLVGDDFHLSLSEIHSFTSVKNQTQTSSPNGGEPRIPGKRVFQRSQKSLRSRSRL